MLKIVLPGLMVFFLLFSGEQCSKKSSDSTNPSGVKEDPSFSGDIQPIFSSSCVSSSCHGTPGQMGLILESGQAYAKLVNISSTEEPSKKRVLPNDAQNSYLVIKIEGRQTIGARMPLGGSLTNDNIQLIKNWTNKGAKNN